MNVAAMSLTNVAAMSLTNVAAMLNVAAIKMGRRAAVADGDHVLLRFLDGSEKTVRVQQNRHVPRAHPHGLPVSQPARGPYIARSAWAGWARSAAHSWWVCRMGCQSS
jgi:hypothetical protein